jgi:hypothetical protein
MPGILLALVIGIAAAASAAAAHTRDLPAVAILLLTGLGAATVGGFAVWLYPGIFLGRHGTWAIAQAANLLPGGAREPLVKLANRELFK